MQGALEPAAEPPVYDEGNPIIVESDIISVDPIGNDVVIAGNEADPEGQENNCSIS